MGNKGQSSGKGAGGAARNYKEVNDDSIFDKSVNDWRDNMTQKELKTTRMYTGSAYYKWNDSLRNNNGEGYEKYTKELDSAISKFDLKNDIIVYRGTGSYAFPGGTPEIGSIISDKAFLSTSVSKDVARDFDSGIILKIQVPSGRGRGAYVKSVSQHKGENEFLMARNTNLKITGKAPGSKEGFSDKQTVVYATYV